MTRGDPFLSPWIWTAGDYLGAVIRITVNFNNSTKALQASSVFRDAACRYLNIYIGTGADGTAEAGKVFPVPAGTSSVTANQLRNNGLNTIDDVMALQITAGP